MSKATFLLYTERKEQINMLTDAERGQLLSAVYEYAENKTLPSFTGAVAICFSLLRADIDRDAKKYNARAGAGVKGGAPKGNSNASKQAKTSKNNLKQPKTSNDKQKQAKQPDTVSVSVSVTDTVTDTVSVKRTPPLPPKGGLDLEPPEVREAMGDFIENRKKLRKPMTDRAIELAVKTLHELSPSPQERVAIINQSIERGWGGLFPLKVESRASPPGEKDVNSRLAHLNQVYENLGGQHDSTGGS